MAYERSELRQLAPKMGELLRKICASCDAGHLITVGDLPGAEKDTAARLRRAEMVAYQSSGAPIRMTEFGRKMLEMSAAEKTA
mgnify:FL=1